MNEYTWMGLFTFFEMYFFFPEYDVQFRLLYQFYHCMCIIFRTFL